MKQYLQLFSFIFLITGIVQAQPTAHITASGPTSFCFGGNVVLTANSGTGYSYQWKKTGVIINGATNISYTATANGNYRCVVTDGSGSSTSNMIAVTIFPNPAPAITGSSPICQGSTATLSAGMGYYCYMWSNGTTTQTINVNTAGTYTVTVCDANGCTGSASMTIIVNPNPTPAITGITTFCQGGSTNLNAGSGYACYIWSTGANTQTINPNIAGTYTVTVCDANGCTGSASTVVTVHPLPTAVLSGNSNICIGSSTNITISFTGIPPFNYSYTDGANVISGAAFSNPLSIAVSPSVTTVYTLISVADQYCSGTVAGSATVTVNPLPTATITGTQSICAGATAVLTITFTGIGPYIFTYNPGGVVVNNVSNPYVFSVSPSVTTNYTLISVANAFCAGTVNGSATVTVTPLPNVAITANGPTTFCLGDSVKLSCNAGLISYQWKRNNIIIAGATFLNYWAKLNGNYRCDGTNASCSGTSNVIHVSVPCVPVSDDQLKTGNQITQLSDIKNSYLVNDHLRLNIPVKSYFLFDSRGVLVEKNSVVNNSDFFDLNFSMLKSGFYFLELFLNDFENSVVKTKVLKL